MGVMEDNSFLDLALVDGIKREPPNRPWQK